MAPQLRHAETNRRLQSNIVMEGYAQGDEEGNCRCGSVRLLVKERDIVVDEYDEQVHEWIPVEKKQSFHHVMKCLAQYLPVNKPMITSCLTNSEEADGVINVEHKKKKTIAAIIGVQCVAMT
jgi:hypothetical protein